MTDCEFNDNDVGGFFLCWRVQESQFERLVCRSNGQFRISIGHKDADNVFVNCKLIDNGKFGLVFRKEVETNGAHRNTWRDCEFTGSEVAIHANGHTYDNVFERCTIGDKGSQALKLLGDVKQLTFKECAVKGAIADESAPDAGHKGLPA